MNIQTQFKTDLTVRSFAYVAKQLSLSSGDLSPSAQYEQILGAAEQHRSALRLAQRDIFEMTQQALRKQTLTKAEFHHLRESAAQVIAQAQQAITRIAAQYAPRKLAA
jgi:hypothetical protein